MSRIKEYIPQVDPVHALQWTMDNMTEVYKLCGKDYHSFQDGKNVCVMSRRSGLITVKPNNFIIRCSKDIYSLPPDKFNKRYTSC